MNYIITNNALEISKELYRLSRPLDYEDNITMFKVVDLLDGRKALMFRTEDEILVHHHRNTDNLKVLIDYSEEQIQQLEVYLESVEIRQYGRPPKSGHVLGRFPFINIVQGFTEIYDREYLITNNLIDAEE
jgi:hypothetical protein